MLNIDALDNTLKYVYQNEASLMWIISYDLVSPTIAVSWEEDRKPGSCSVSLLVTVSACLQFTLESQRNRLKYQPSDASVEQIN